PDGPGKKKPHTSEDVWGRSFFGRPKPRAKSGDENLPVDTRSRAQVDEVLKLDHRVDAVLEGHSVAVVVDDIGVALELEPVDRTSRPGRRRIQVILEYRRRCESGPLRRNEGAGAVGKDQLVTRAADRREGGGREIGDRAVAVAVERLGDIYRVVAS